jgi:MoaA/NifB/PqqE/SkfB family radical SAM enzyme
MEDVTEKTPPHSVELHPTYKCNLRCVYCNAWLQSELQIDTLKNFKCLPRRDAISKERWLVIAKELCEMGVKEIEITGGGEPLIVPYKTLSLMELIKSYNITGKLVTNGTLWNEKYIKKTIEMGWDRITFGIDAPDEKTHDFLKGVKGAFKKVIKNIQLFNKYKKVMKKENPLLTLQTVLCTKNYIKILGIVKLADELQIDSVILNPVFDKNPTCNKIKLNSSQMEIAKELLKDAKQLSNQFRIELSSPIFRAVTFTPTIKNPDFSNLKCHEPCTRAKIDTDGCVGPCSGFVSSENIKQKSFSEIWYGELFNAFRRKIKSGDMPNVCMNCVHSSSYWYHHPK